MVAQDTDAGLGSKSLKNNRHEGDHPGISPDAGQGRSTRLNPGLVLFEALCKNTQVDTRRRPATAGEDGLIAGSLRRRARHHAPDYHQLGKGPPSTEEDGRPSAVGSGKTGGARRVGEYGGGSSPRSPVAGDGAAGGRSGSYSAGAVADRPKTQHGGGGFRLG